MNGNINLKKNLTSGVITKHFYVNGIQVGKMVGSSTYYYQSDRLGSTRLVTNSSGSTMFSTNYQPFGLSYGASGSDTFMFTGKSYDSSSGLYYYGARYYNPAISRFITEDEPTTCSCKNTTKSVQENPLGLNRYIYALNNPLRFVDRNGHDAYQTCETVVDISIQVIIVTWLVLLIYDEPIGAAIFGLMEIFEPVAFEVLMSAVETVSYVTTQLICHSFQNQSST